jgi:hypothetical protein
VAERRHAVDRAFAAEAGSERRRHAIEMLARMDPANTEPALAPFAMAA